MKENNQPTKLNNLEIITNWPKEPEFLESEQIYFQDFQKALLENFDINHINKAKYIITSTDDYALHSWIIDLDYLVEVTDWKSLQKNLEGLIAQSIEGFPLSYSQLYLEQPSNISRVCVHCIEDL